MAGNLQAFCLTTYWHLKVQWEKNGGKLCWSGDAPAFYQCKTSLLPKTGCVIMTLGWGTLGFAKTATVSVVFPGNDTTCCYDAHMPVPKCLKGSGLQPGNPISTQFHLYLI